MSDQPPPPPRKNVRGPALVMLAGTAFAAIATGFVKIHEGRSLTTYPDLLTISHVLTNCDGHTGSDVKMGQVKTNAECDAITAKDIVSHGHGVAQCVHRDISAPTLAAFVSIGYNVGTSTFCRSSMAADYNAGREAQSCHDITKYVFSGGKDCRIASNRCGGIPARRRDEEKLCLGGLD